MQLLFYGTDAAENSVAVSRVRSMEVLVKHYSGQGTEKLPPAAAAAISKTPKEPETANAIHNLKQILSVTTILQDGCLVVKSPPSDISAMQEVKDAVQDAKNMAEKWGVVAPVAKVVAEAEASLEAAATPKPAPTADSADKAQGSPEKTSLPAKTPGPATVAWGVPHSEWMEGHVNIKTGPRLSQTPELVLMVGCGKDPNAMDEDDVGDVVLALHNTASVPVTLSPHSPVVGMGKSSFQKVDLKTPCGRVLQWAFDGASSAKRATQCMIGFEKPGEAGLKAVSVADALKSLGVDVQRAASPDLFLWNFKSSVGPNGLSLKPIAPIYSELIRDDEPFTEEDAPWLSCRFIFA